MKEEFFKSTAHKSSQLCLLHSIRFWVVLSRIVILWFLIISTFSCIFQELISMYYTFRTVLKWKQKWIGNKSFFKWRVRNPCLFATAGYCSHLHKSAPSRQANCARDTLFNNGPGQANVRAARADIWQARPPQWQPHHWRVTPATAQFFCKIQTRLRSCWSGVIMIRDKWPKLLK